MTAVVTLNSIGTGVTGSSHPTLTPAPPISNCLGKMVYLVVTVQSGNADIINAPTGATYYLLGKGATDVDALSVYYKNGEASEPTPSIAITGTGFGNCTAQIFVLDIAGGTFPTVAADGDARLATASGRNTAVGVTYGALTVVGGGYGLQFGSKFMSTGSASAVGTTAAFTQTAFTAVAQAVLGSAQLQNAATVLGVDMAANNVSITTCSDNPTNGTHTLTVEMNVTQVAPINYVPQGNRIYVLP